MKNEENTDRLKSVFSDNLKRYMEERAMNTADLARLLSYPFTTVSDWVNGRKYPRMDKIQKIADYFGILKSDLTEEQTISQDYDDTKKKSYSDEAMKLAEDYDDLDRHGQRVVRLVTDEEKDRCEKERKAKEKAEKDKAMRAQRVEMETAEEISPVIPLPQPYSQVAAAEGAGAFLDDDGYEMIAVEMNEYTKMADVIIKVIGRSMEPVVSDGDRILVRKQPSVNVGEIGVFIIDGEGFLKEYAKDRLISLNPDVEDVVIGDFQSVECYGKFISVLNPEWVK